MFMLDNNANRRLRLQSEEMKVGYAVRRLRAEVTAYAIELKRKRKQLACGERCLMSIQMELRCYSNY